MKNETRPKAPVHDERARGTPADWKFDAIETVTPVLPREELAYSIINAFLGFPNLQSTAAEQIIRDVVSNEESWPAKMLLTIEEVFSPVFFNYTNGLQDRTTWTVRDPKTLHQEVACVC